jgi:hypothetical protein
MALSLLWGWAGVWEVFGRLGRKRLGHFLRRRLVRVRRDFEPAGDHVLLDADDGLGGEALRVSNVRVIFDWSLEIAQGDDVAAKCAENLCCGIGHFDTSDSAKYGPTGARPQD